MLCVFNMSNENEKGQAMKMKKDKGTKNEIEKTLHNKHAFSCLHHI